MTFHSPCVDWSVEVAPKLDDRAREALSESLGISFHGVNTPHAYTIAHRFIDGDPDVLLRMVRTSLHGPQVELVRFNGAEYARSSALKNEVREAISGIPAQPAEAQLAARRGFLRRPSGTDQSDLSRMLDEAVFSIRARVAPVGTLSSRGPAKAIPMALQIPRSMGERLGPRFETYAMFDGRKFSIWLSNIRVDVPRAQVLIYATDPDGSVISATANFDEPSGQFRAEFPWAYGSPPVEVHIAIMSHG
ncbi:MAG: hypothetical protein JHC98_05950 [Thermoleophilaceae bacterium]|nr:hypothetical protein [Thermoleophilaceae bacterium]